MSVELYDSEASVWGWVKVGVRWWVWEVGIGRWVSAAEVEVKNWVALNSLLHNFAALLRELVAKEAVLWGMRIFNKN